MLKWIHSVDCVGMNTPCWNEHICVDRVGMNTPCWNEHIAMTVLEWTRRVGMNTLCWNEHARVGMNTLCWNEHAVLEWTHCVEMNTPVTTSMMFCFIPKSDQLYQLCGSGVPYLPNFWLLRQCALGKSGKCLAVWVSPQLWQSQDMVVFPCPSHVLLLLI